MSNNQKLKVIISYSHLDEDYIKDFRKHIEPLKLNGLVEDWHDRKIIPGKDFQNEIDSNFSEGDVICLFISANFYSSPACLEEIETALKLRKEKGITVLPIILSPCGWLDIKPLSSLLALPTDGKPVSSHQDSNSAWFDVYTGLSKLVNELVKIKQLQITEGFLNFLHSTELLTKAHSNKNEINLDEIFVYPDLDKHDNLGEKKVEESSRKLLENLVSYNKILIAGENQAGKTTLCKKIFLELKKQNFIPVYITDKNNQHKGGLELNLSNAYKEQYQGESLENNKERIVPIVDNFHLAKHKEKYIRDLACYKYQVIVVDDIFSLNFEDENLISSFTQFKIKEYTPALRNELIKKWILLTDKDTAAPRSNDTYQKIDTTTELVDSSLGTGIVPAYPFFILSIISTTETFKPLDQEITSQGYCYQALIYIYLRKQGVKGDEIEIYLNFLTELAFYFYQKNKTELSQNEFDSFMEQYLTKYNLPTEVVEIENLLGNLERAQIIKLDNCNNYSFFYEYIYYFFAAKYLAEHLKDNEKIIELIISNLHKDENAYIAIFISHHSKNNEVLDNIILRALYLFNKYTPASLSKKELTFFDKQTNIIVNAAIPTRGTPEKERAKKLEKQNLAEQHAKKQKNKPLTEEENNELEIELRRSIKTVEVMGRIIKNRAGSLEKSRLEEIFGEAINVHLRILASFFEVIQNEEGVKEITSFIQERLSKIVEDKTKERLSRGEKIRDLSKEVLEKRSKAIFWNTNFFFVYGLINKIINSLGSNKLIKIAEAVCDRENTPAHFLVKHGILMWYGKRLEVDNIAKKVHEEDFSEIAKKTMNFMVVNHCAMHQVDMSIKQKISNKLKIPLQKLLNYTKPAKIN